METIDSNKIGTRVEGMKKVGLIVGICLVVLCGGGFAVSKILGGAMAKQKEAQDAAKAVETVQKGDLTVQVVETGSLQPVRTVEVKSRVGGRVAKLYVDEGDYVKQGQLIAVIDPQETELQVKQNRAQLRGAQSSAQRTDIELAQRKSTVRTALEKAKSRLGQVEKELKVQPKLTTSSIVSAQSAYDSAVQSMELLKNITQPNTKSTVEKEARDARDAADQAARELERRKNLLAKGYVPKRDVETAQMDLNSAKTRLNTAEQKLARLPAEQQLEVRQAEERIKDTKAALDRSIANRIQDDSKRDEYIRALNDLRDAQTSLRDVEALRAGKNQQLASVEQIQTQLSDALRQLGETEIRAPVSGIVSKRLVQEGELVSSLGSFSSGTPVVRIDDRSAMLIKLQINEIDVAKLKTGLATKVDVDAFPGKTFEGKVSKISPANTTASANNASTSGDPVVKYDVEVRMENAPDILKTGMSARCTMIVSELKNVLKLPAEFVGRDKDVRFVMVLPAGAKAGDPKVQPTRVVVKVGESVGAFTQVIEGVKEGDRVAKPAYNGPKRKGAMQFGPDDEGGGDSKSGKAEAKK